MMMTEVCRKVFSSIMDRNHELKRQPVENMTGSRHPTIPFTLKERSFRVQRIAERQRQGTRRRF